MLARQEHVRDVLEIGTYNGEGSTYLLARALQATGGRLWSIEAHADHYRMARDFFRDKQLPVELVHGLSLPRDAHRPFHEYWPLIEATVHEDEFPGDYLNWYHEERALAQRAERDFVLRDLLEQVGGFDLVLLDGGEFLSGHEFTLLEPHIRHYVVMDDTNGVRCIKNAEPRDRILASSEWQVIVDALDERNGWLAARRVGKPAKTTPSAEARVLSGAC
jgi:hypothetical protein